MLITQKSLQICIVKRMCYPHMQCNLKALQFEGALKVSQIMILIFYMRLPFFLSFLDSNLVWSDIFVHLLLSKTFAIVVKLCLWNFYRLRSVWRFKCCPGRLDGSKRTNIFCYPISSRILDLLIYTQGIFTGLQGLYTRTCEL